MDYGSTAIPPGCMMPIVCCWHYLHRFAYLVQSSLMVGQ